MSHPQLCAQLLGCPLPPDPGEEGTSDMALPRLPRLARESLPAPAPTTVQAVQHQQSVEASHVCAHDWVLVGVGATCGLLFNDARMEWQCLKCGVLRHG